MQLTDILMQTEPHHSVSSKYNLINSMDVIQKFERFGFEIDSIEAAGTRKLDRALKQPHMIKLTTGESIFGGEMKPQVIIHNSYDGARSLNIRVGLFRFVCANGIVAGHNMIPAAKINHSNTGWEQLVDNFIDTYEDKYRLQKEHISNMKERTMSLDEAYHIAEQAIEFRHSDKRITNDIVDPLELLIAKRREDRGQDAWSRFNVLQESMINGYYRKYTNTGSIQKAKIITDISENLRVNTSLSDLFAEALC